MACNKNHDNTDNIVKDLPIGQEGVGRHKCASCAYEIGYQHGLQKAENINLADVLDGLEESQKGVEDIEVHTLHILQVIITVLQIVTK